MNPRRVGGTNPKNQEGANISRAEQAAFLPLLRQELDARGLQNLPISAADENSMNAARDTYDAYKTAGVAALVGRANVHSYSGLDPMRDNGARQKLRQGVGDKTLWASEFGDNGADGAALAQTVLEDLHFLQPSAWTYWQVLEPSSPWGPINADFGRDERDFQSGKPREIFNKFFILAGFSRFIRDGDEILDTSDQNTVVALNRGRGELKIVTANWGDARPMSFDLSAFKPLENRAKVTQTRFDGTKQFVSFPLELQGKSLKLFAEEKSLYSIKIPVLLN